MDNDDKLKLLGQIAADVPERVAALYEEVEEFQEAMQTRDMDFNLVKSDLDDRLNDVAQYLSEYIEEGVALREAITAETDEAKAALDEVGSHWSAEYQEFSTALEQVSSEVQLLDTSVGETNKRLTTAVEQLQSAEAQLTQQLESIREETTTKFGELHEGMTSMQKTVTEVEQEGQQAVASLGERIQEQETSLSARAEELARECGSLVEKFEDLVTDIHLDVLTGGVGTMVEALVQKVENEAKEIIRDMLARVFELLEELVETITKSSDEAAALRDALEPIIDQLEELLEPLKYLIDAVSSVAGLFGSVASIF